MKCQRHKNKITTMNGCIYIKQNKIKCRHSSFMHALSRVHSNNTNNYRIAPTKTITNRMNKTKRKKICWIFIFSHILYIKYIHSVSFAFLFHFLGVYAPPPNKPNFQRNSCCSKFLVLFCFVSVFFFFKFFIRRSS